MSKYSTLILPFFLALPLILQLFNNCNGQDIDVVISIRSSTSTVAEISGRFSPTAKPTPNFSILREYAGFAGLAERVSDLSLEDAAGNPVAYRQHVPGEYVTAGNFVSWCYRVDLRPNKRPAAVAHTSWVGPDEGLLFLKDLLPRIASGNRPVTGKIKLQLPEGWMAAGGRSTFEVSDIERFVIFVGKNLRERRVNAGDIIFRTVSTGEWKFSEAESADFATEIYGEYRKMFGAAPASEAQIFLLHFPQNVGPGEWEADTRGSTVTTVSSDMPFRTQSIQRLHEQLRHEIFHLWLPNAVNLTGSYDWFYEGFALYQALKTGVMLNRLTFDNFLDTLSSAYMIDSSMSNRRSLIELSANRASGGDTLIYARGMLIAFLVDVELLQQSHGKRDASTLLRSIFEKYRDPNRAFEGNRAVLDAIANPEINRYVNGSDAIDWRDELQVVGIEAVTENSVTTLKIVRKPSGRQRELLDKLGYNNWRKLPITHR